jgi:hypothetical protein
MRDWPGFPGGMLEDPKTRDFAVKVDYFLRDLSRGIQRIQKGEVPDGTGNPLPSAPPFTGTPGSVVFVGADTFLDEDNDNFFWDDTNNRLGLGTKTPGAILDVAQDAGLISLPSASITPNQDWGTNGAFGGVAWQCIETDDGATSYIRNFGDAAARLADFSVTNGPLSTAVNNWTVTFVARYNPTLNPPSAGTTLTFGITRSNLQQKQSPAFDATTLTNSFASYTTTVTFDGTGETVDTTANKFRVNNTVTIAYNGYIEITFISIQPTGGTGATDLTYWRAGSGKTIITKVDAVGRLGVGTGSLVLNRMLTILPDAAATVGMAIIAAASQTGNLFDFRSATDAATIAAITKDGYFSTKQLLLNGSTSGTLTTVPAATTTSHTLTMPSAQGESATVLTNDGAGALSWGRAIVRLGSATVNMQNAAGAQTIFTTAAGRITRITHVVVRDTTATLAGGTAFAFTSWRTVDLSTMTTANTTYRVLTATDNTDFAEIAASTAFQITPSTGSTGAASATIDVFGYTT